MPEHIASITKSDKAKRLVYAEVYSPNRPDTDNEYMTAAEIEKMSHEFMRTMKLDAVDTMHEQVHQDGCCVVESFIARKGDPDFIEGAWVIGMHVNNDTLWEKIEKGELNGFSMEALVIKETKDVEMEVPPIVSGLTMKSEDHSHQFFVSYDDEGKFKGGKTDTVNGHSHVIKRGTITEEADGHSHRFHHVDQLQIKA